MHFNSTPAFTDANEMKEVLLINPPRSHYPNFNRFIVNLPLGLMSLASYLRKHSVPVSILDCLIDSFEIQQRDGYKIYGMPFMELKRRVSKIDPDIIGITFPFSTQYDICLETVKVVKQALPHVPIIVGGPHVTVASDELLNASSDIDVCVIGEGEKTLYEFVDSYNAEMQTFASLDKIKGIVYRNVNGEVKHSLPREPIVNLDGLPYPAYDLVNMDRYLHNKYSYGRPPGFENINSINMITSRGCPYDCVFCSIHLSMGKKWRSHSAEYVIKQIEFLIDRFNVKYIHFEDDNLSLNVKRFDRIIDMLSERGIKIGWDNQNGMRADKWTYERLLKVKKSGCSFMVFSIESGNQEVLDLIVRKKLKLTDAIESIKLCKKVGIPMAVFFVIGIPGETIAQMKQTLKLSIKLYILYDVSSFIMVATPFLGTRLHKICLENGYITKPITPQNIVNTTLNTSNSIIRTPLFGPEDIKKLSIWYFGKLMRIAKYIKLLINATILIRSDFKMIINKTKHYAKKKT